MDSKATAVTRCADFGAYTLVGDVTAQGSDQRDGNWVTIMVTSQLDRHTGQPSRYPTMVGRKLSFSLQDTTPLSK